jgi:hypothetical protein
MRITMKSLTAVFILMFATMLLGCDQIKNAIQDIADQMGIGGDVQMPDFQVAVSVDGADAPAMVRCGVSAVDKDGNAVSLDPTRVKIYESRSRDGDWTQRDFTSERRSDANIPISVAAVMDSSASMSDDQLNDSENGVASFAGNLAEGDRMAVIKFANEIEVKQPFTDDVNKIGNAIDSPYTGDDIGTALWDAVQKGVDMTYPEPAPKAILAFSDGGDNASNIDYSALAQYAVDRGVPVYCLGLTGNIFGIELGSFLEDMVKVSNLTGGLFFEFPDSGDMQKIYIAIADAFDEALVATWTSDFDSGAVYVKVEVSADVGGKTYEDSAISSYTIQ